MILISGKYLQVFFILMPHLLSEFCPVDPTKTKIGDYFFVKDHGAKKNQPDAHEYCSSTYPGSRLAKPESTEELDAMYTALESKCNDSIILIIS